MSDELPPAPVSAPHSGRWQKGQSGNPGGRPKNKIFRQKLIELLERANSTEKQCLALMARSENGDVAAFKEIADRVDGKVPTPVGGTDDLPPIKGFAWLDPTTKE